MDYHRYIGQRLTQITREDSQESGLGGATGIPAAHRFPSLDIEAHQILVMAESNPNTLCRRQDSNC